MRRLALAVSLCALSIACAHVDRALVAPNDWDAYKHYRWATNDAEKLHFAWDYLRDHPRGAFAADVRKWFEPRELKFWAEAGQTSIGANAYLEILPDGPHADEERKYLAAYERDKIEEPLRVKKALEEARKRAEQARKAAGEAIESWTRRALSLTTWGEPIAKTKMVDKSFGEALAEDPAASCDAEGCTKHLYFKYPVPDASPPMDRIVPIVVRVDATEDRLSSVTIVAPKGGFTWWLEGAEARGVDVNDGNDRAQAIVRAKNRIESVTRDALGAGVTCSTTEEPTMRTIDCGKLRVIVAAEPSGDDVVRVVGGL